MVAYNTSQLLLLSSITMKLKSKDKKKNTFGRKCFITVKAFTFESVKSLPFENK